MELTNGKPQLRAGDLICDDHRLNTPRGGFLHCAREDYGRESATLRDGVAQDGRLFCDNFVICASSDALPPGSRPIRPAPDHATRALPRPSLAGHPNSLAAHSLAEPRPSAGICCAVPYLDTVLPGDGGLAVLPGSHKAAYHRPDDLFSVFSQDSRRSHRETPEVFDDPARQELPQELQELGMRSLCPRAGDALLLPEATTHAVLPWRPRDRPRRTLMLRYQPQWLHDSHDDPSRTWPPTVLERLAPETLELLDSAHVTHTKGVATQREVRLGGGAARL